MQIWTSLHFNPTVAHRYVLFPAEGARRALEHSPGSMWTLRVQDTALLTSERLLQPCDQTKEPSWPPLGPSSLSPFPFSFITTEGVCVRLCVLQFGEGG